MNKIRHSKIFRGKNVKMLSFFMIFAIIATAGETSAGVIICNPSPEKQIITHKKTTINLKNKSLRFILMELQKLSGIGIAFKDEGDIDKYDSMSVNEKEASVDEILNRLLTQTDLSYTISNNTIIIAKKRASESKNEIREKIKVKGVVIASDNRKPVVGATIIVKEPSNGAITDDKGAFTVSVFADSELEVSYVGMKTVVYNQSMSTDKNIVIEMSKDILAMDDVIVTGLFERNSKTFTGSTSSFKGEDLKRVGNQNLISSLKNLDPSFMVIESLAFGSDPNKLPEIQMRGLTSIPNLKGDYEGNPNQPLFILDGFETSIEKVYDLNMNLIKGVTLLKDAAAKAIYGSKAANGVVVIETIQPESGKLRISYTGNLDITAPDLTSYELCSASEKLRAEVMAGKYLSTNPTDQANLIEEYNKIANDIARGVDTYWLSQPVRTGIGHKHSIYLDGGDDAMRYSANLSYNNIKGVMKGSDRSTISGSVVLAYRYKSLSFRNNLLIDNNRAENSTYGSFTSYANMNPYLRIRDEKGSLIKDYGSSVYNPLYNATLNCKDESDYVLVTNNFYGEWSILPNLKVTGRVGVTINNSGSEIFKPSAHTDFKDIQTWDENYINRGSYSHTNEKKFNVSADFGVNYSLNKNRHSLYLNAAYSLTDDSYERSTTTVIGFPSDRLDYISAGNSYSKDKPVGAEGVTRSLSIIGSLNYSYDNRYLLDASWRSNGSSQFGSENRFGQFWATGIGWNVHNEKMMSRATFITMLKVRASLGYTGSQNFNPYQAISTYQYITDKMYDGDMGLVLSGLANNGLMWQKQFDKNIGLDLALFNVATITFDYYSNLTDNLITDISVAPSVGFTTYKENMGETLNEGFQIATQFKLYASKTKNRYVNLSINALRNNNKVRKISDALKEYNKQIDEQKEEFSATNPTLQAMQRDPSLRFEEGQSLTAIWAVRSKGIDPVTGNEVFIRKDGSETFQWYASDQVVCGNTRPKLNGNVGLNGGWGGLSLSLAFTYSFGGQTYNSTLVHKIENADIKNNNVDRRALTERWNTSGQSAKYKDIKNASLTKTTSRFVEDFNEFVFSSISVSYDFSTLAFVRKLSLSRLQLSFNMSDLGRLSTVKQERGTEYPFARVFSFGLQATF